jgi:glycosyltransferase involved in cell wall biosynthesis
METHNVAVSIIVPAHNEEKLLGGTLRTLAASAAAMGEPYEIIVVDDGSTDRTAQIAGDHGARVVAVNVRHIAAARNAGARDARGQLFVFVDADTLVPASVLGQAIAAWREGAVGGGAMAIFPEGTAWWASAMISVTCWFMSRVRWAAGCFVFARRDAFERVRGFDERFYASEEIHFSRAIKKHGRFVIVTDPVMTSARKSDRFTLSQVAWQIVKLARPGSTKSRAGLEFWYGKREDE